MINQLSPAAYQMRRLSRVCFLVLLLAVIPQANAEDPADGSVQFIVGDYLTTEGGHWNADDSPLREPFGLDFDSQGRMYIVELTSGGLHQIDRDGSLTTLRRKHKPGYKGDRGPVSKAFFNGPHNCVVSATDDLLVADSWNHCVRKIDLTSMNVETIVGGGTQGFSGDGGQASRASFDFIMCIALNSDRSILHITDLKNRRIRNVDLETGVVTTVAGNGQKGVPIDGKVANQSPLVDPRAAASDGRGNLYILERGGHALRLVDQTGKIRTVAGTGRKGFQDGTALDASFGAPKHLCCDPEGNVYIADDNNGAIRKYDPMTKKVTTVLGKGYGDPRITLRRPHGVRWHKGRLYICDTYQHRILTLKLPNG